MLSPFKSGYWVWDDNNNGLQFMSREVNVRSPSITTTITTLSKASQVPTDIRFRETVDQLEQIKFRRHYQRKCKPNEPEVVTIQDVKDVALFMAHPKNLTPEFIRYFHIPTMDRFLRALILYFQCYLQVCDHLMIRREEAKRKLHQPIVTVLENVIRDDLSDLRSMVAREYGCLLMGVEDAKTFHHMNNKNHDSLSDKDRRLFEVLICVVVRVVWIALQRKYLSLIELETNRLMRSDIFNVVIHRGIRGGIGLSRTPHEDEILTGKANVEERKLLQRSPVTKELVLGEHDYRMLGIGFRQFEPTDERLEYLEAAFAAPEEILLKLKVTIGLLGIPRSDFDSMLLPRERTKKDINKPPREIPEFKMPPRVEHDDKLIPKVFPKELSHYHETKQTIRARNKQCKRWRERVERAMIGVDTSVADLTVASASSTVLMTSRSSMSFTKAESLVDDLHK